MKNFLNYSPTKNKIQRNTETPHCRSESVLVIIAKSISSIFFQHKGWSLEVSKLPTSFNKTKYFRLRLDEVSSERPKGDPRLT